MERNLVLKVHYYQIVCMHDQHLKDLQQYYYVNDGPSIIDKMCVHVFMHDLIETVLHHWNVQLTHLPSLLALTVK